MITFTERNKFIAETYVGEQMQSMLVVGCNFNCCDFSYTLIKDCVFKDCIFTNCKFEDTIIKNSYLHGCVVNCVLLYLKTQDVGFDLSGNSVLESIPKHIVWNSSNILKRRIYHEFLESVAPYYNITLDSYDYDPLFTAISNKDDRYNCIREYSITLIMSGCVDPELSKHCDHDPNLSAFYKANVDFYNKVQNMYNTK